MPRNKFAETKHEASIQSLVEDFASETAELAAEMREWADNMEEKLSHTEKYDRVSSAADELESYESELDVPEVIAELVGSYMNRRKKSAKSPYPRWLRAENAGAKLRAAMETSQEWLDENEHHDDADEVQSFITDAEEATDAVEGVEFPGMFG